MYNGGLIPAGYGAESRVWLGDLGQGGLYDSGEGHGADAVVAMGEGAILGAEVAVGAAGGAAALATAASLGGASAAAATVPVAGWIAAAAIGTAATVVAMVGVIQNRNVDKAKAVAIATALGIPDAKNIEGYVLKAMRWDEYKVNRKLSSSKKIRDALKGRRAVSGRYKKAVMKTNVLQGIKVIQKQARKARLREEMGITTPAPPETKAAPRLRVGMLTRGIGRGLSPLVKTGTTGPPVAKAAATGTFPTVPVAIVGTAVVLFLLTRRRK